MVTSLLTIQCLLCVLPCLARPYSDLAPSGQFLVGDQVVILFLIIWLTQFSHSLERLSLKCSRNMNWSR